MSRKDSKERTETSRKESERTKDDGRILTLKDKKKDVIGPSDLGNLALERNLRKKFNKRL